MLQQDILNKMGVPTLFADLLKKNPRCVGTSPPTGTNFLFIDFNSIIYDVLHTLTGNVDHNIPLADFTQRLIIAVGNRLHQMIGFIRPTDLIYIAMDGVPPRAKMVQQRARRYKGIKERDRNQRILRSHGQPIPYEWDTTQISPGTAFMQDMAAHLRQRILAGDYVAAASGPEQLQIILSDTTVPGEGEHKYLPLMKRFRDKKSVIYSPDGDMIILAISTNLPQLTIMRKADNPSDGEFSYMNIDMVRSEYERLMANEGLNPHAYMQDFVLLSCLAGNDFVVPPPYLKIKYRDLGMGLDFLMSVYREIHAESGHYLVTPELDINMAMFMRIAERIAGRERGFYQALQRKRDQVRRRRHDAKLEEQRREKTPWDFERGLYDHVEFFSPYHPEHVEYNPEFDRIDYFGPDYRHQYYETFFHDSSDQLVDMVCQQYLLTIWFNIRYYFGELPTWRFYYRYEAPPLYTDLVRYMEHHRGSWSTFFRMEMEGPLDPYVQLMLILPHSSARTMLPRSLTEPMTRELREYYPMDFRLNVLLGMKGIYSEPILPDIPLERIMALYERVQRGFTEQDRERNRLSKKPQYFSRI